MLSKMPTLPNKPFKFLFHASKPYAGWAFGAFFAVTVAQVLGTLSPYFFGKIVDAASSGGDFETVKFWLLVTIATLVLMYISWRSSGLMGMQWVARSNAHSYKQLFSYLSNHSHSYFSNRFAGALSNKVSNASDGASGLGENILWHYYSSILSITFSGVLIFIANVYVGFIYVALIIVLVIVNSILVQMRRKYVIQYAKENSTLRGQAVDISTNMDAVRFFAQRGFEQGFLGKQIDIRRAADIKQWRFSEYILIINNVIVVSAVAGMFLLLLNLFERGEVTLGIFIMVLSLIFSLSGTLTFIGSMMNGFIRVYGEIEEGLSEILLPHDIVDMKGAKDLSITNGSLSFENMAFAYNKEDVFTDFNLYIAPGEKVGIVGPSGAGKTTLINLLLRQHDITGGAIKIDGQDIHRVTQDSLRENIAVVPQEPLLFHRSIKENIAYGNQKATQKQIEAAAKMAEAHDFILETPEKYKTQVGERGVKLSGGQKQRIAVARAMLKSAPILVLDEATSALDSESEALIQKALHDLMKGKTVLAIAHRLSTLREMDRIIVMEGGSIVQSGTHQELVAEEGSLYARLWAHQAEGFLKEEE